jgi:hypothetical protein
MSLVSGGASAKENKVTGSDNQAHVVAHISFSGLSAVDMVMQRKVNNTYYLYVQHSKDQGVSIIDITKPAQPKAIGAIPWPDPAVSSTVNVTGDLAIIAESQVMHSTSNDALVLWDLSNPAAPRVVQRFSGVVKWLQDERNFIYVLNGDGLWVVSEPAGQQPKPEQAERSTYGGWGMPHFSPPVLDTNQKFQYAFMEPGKFQYLWFLSSWMKFASVE